MPWAPLGSSQATVIPVVQAASVVGVYGLSALVALVGTAAAAVALTRDRAQRGGAIAVALLLAAVVAGGLLRVNRGVLLHEGASFKAGLVQGSIKQEDKYDPELRDVILGRYLDLSRQVIGEGADLVVWPEAATPFYFDLQANFAAPVRRLAVEAKTPFLIGTDEFVPATAEAPDRYFNAAVLVGRDGRSRGVVPEDAARAVRRVRAAQTPAVLRRPAHRGGERFLGGDRAGRVRRRRPPFQCRHLLRVGVPVARARVRRCVAASCS